MKVPLVMTVIGRDQPGLVEKLAELITKVGGNWVESRMARLGGEFAGILRVTVPNDRREEFEMLVREELVNQMHVVIKPDQGQEEPSQPERIGRVEVTGHDRPGIVHQIASVLARYKVNVEELVSTVTSTPMSGEPRFRAVAKVRLPDACRIDDLKTELEKIAQDLMVDLEIEMPSPGRADEIACQLGTELV